MRSRINNLNRRPTYVPLHEAARYVPYSQEYLGLLARRGKLDAKKIGRNWHATRESVLEYYKKYNGVSDTRYDIVSDNYNLKPEYPYKDAPLPGEEVFYKPLLQSQLYQQNQQAQLPDDYYYNPILTDYTAPQRPENLELGTWNTEQRNQNREHETLHTLEEQQQVFVEPKKEEPRVSRFGGGNFRKKIFDFRPSEFKVSKNSPAMFVLAAVILFIIFGGVRLSFADELLASVKNFFTDAASLQGKFSGTHADELLVLNNEGNIDIYGSIKSKAQLISDAPQGTSPLVVASSTTVPNLSSQYLDGLSKYGITLNFVTQNGNTATRQVELLGGVQTTDILASSLATSGPVNVTGALNVSGKTTLAELDLNSDLLVKSNLTVNGVTNLKGTNINGNLLTTGPATFQDSLYAQYINTPTASIGRAYTGFLNADNGFLLGNENDTQVVGAIYTKNWSVTPAGKVTLVQADIGTISSASTTFDGNIVLNSPYGVTLNAGNISGNQLSAPSGLSTQVATGGSLVADTYYYVVTALNANGETTSSTEASRVIDGVTETAVTLTWNELTGATSYRIYGRATGAQNVYFTVTEAVGDDTDSTVTFTDTGSAGTAGTVPTTNSTGGAATFAGNLTVNGLTTLGNLNTLDTLTGNLLTSSVTSGATTQTAFSLTSSSLTTGEAFDLTSTSTPIDGSTNEAIDINITHSPTTTADNFRSFDLDTSDATALANTIYNFDGTLTLTGNAAKTGIGIYQTVTSSSTTADTLASVDLASSVTGIMTTGTRSVYGIRNQPSAGAESTGGTTNVYGEYIKITADVAAGGTVNGYGLYVANGTFYTDGTRTQYGLYIEAPTGADTNYVAWFGGGEVRMAGFLTMDGGITLPTDAGAMTFIDLPLGTSAQGTD